MAKNKKSQKPKKNVTEAVTPSDVSIETETQNQVNEIENSEETVETKQDAVEKGYLLPVQKKMLTSLKAEQTNKRKA